MTTPVNRVTYDPEVDAAYIRLVNTGDGKKLTTLALENRPIHLDFDHNDNLVGVEVLSASEHLPDEFLNGAQEL